MTKKLNTEMPSQYQNIDKNIPMDPKQDKQSKSPSILILFLTLIS